MGHGRGALISVDTKFSIEPLTASQLVREAELRGPQGAQSPRCPTGRQKRWLLAS